MADPYNFALMVHKPTLYRPLSYEAHRMSSSNDDGQQNFIVGVLFAVIALVLLLVIGIAIRHVHGKAGAGPVPAAAVAIAIPEGASIRVENGIVKFYFESGRAELAAGAKEALADVVKGVASGRKAVVSGFHDSTGDAAINEELAKKRAQAVQQVLVAHGAPADRIDLKKPAVSTGSGSNAQARRVEVKLMP